MGKTTWLTPWLDMVELKHGPALVKDARFRGRLMAALKRIRVKENAQRGEMLTRWRLYVPQVGFPSPEYFERTYDCWSPERLRIVEVDKQLDRQRRPKEIISKVTRELMG